ncbi:hypothetical protein KUCAC02_014739 [Chaenocephalus aceratus]|uniref:Uncharacterized protein n=1 Tax=Chaenocephalus aceratus TaxID=36190 RepID=A0ACB9WEQ7_CHAAC|nr:hypothetical protein KUCAC02_014739 [Chaenocephalus aceratus]
MHSYRKNCLESGNGLGLAVIRPIDRERLVQPRGQEPFHCLASCPCVFLDARGPQLLVRAPPASILSVSAAETK